MSIPTPVRGLITFGMIVIVGAGAYWVGRQQGKISVMSERVEAAVNSAAPELERLQQETTRLKTENERLLAQATAAEMNRTTTSPTPNEIPAGGPGAITSAERRRVLADMQDKKLINIVTQMVGRDGKVQNAFTELFDLTPSEKTTLQQAIDRAMQQNGQVTAANTTLARRADGAVIISVPASPAGIAVRDELLATFAQTLGPERNVAFLALNQSIQPGQISNVLGGIGASDRTVTLTRDPGSNGTGRINVTDAHRNTNGTNTGNITMSMSVSDPAQLPENLRWLVPLVPADF